VNRDRERDVEAQRALLLKRRLKGESAGRARPAVTPRTRPTVLPLSFSQERLWFLSRLRPESSEYALPLAVRLTGPIEADRVEHAVSAVVARHEVLRTHIVAVEGRASQVVQEPKPVQVRLVDLSGADGQAVDGDEPEARAQRHAEADLALPFDLETESPIRASLLRLGPRDHMLLLVLHHVAFDGWSADILLRDLGAAYEALASGTDPVLPDAPAQYGDFTVRQRAEMTGARTEADLGYWREVLAGSTATSLPTDHPRPASWDPRGASVSVGLPTAMSRALDSLARRSKATPYMVFLAAFHVLLARSLGTDDVVVGTPVAGRTRPETESMIGFFVNTVVVRGKLADSPRFSTYLARVRESVLGAFSHQDLPFEYLVDQLAPERSLSRNPLFQIMFALESSGPDAGEIRLGGAAGELVSVENRTAKFDLTWTIRQCANGSYELHAQYAVALFDEKTIDRLVARFLQLLGEIAAAEDAPVDRYDLMTEEDRASLTVRRPQPKEPQQTIDDCFAEIVARHPESVALIHGDASMSYSELDRRSNRVARYLKGLGVGPEVRVAVMLPRGFDVVVAFLGILKAGGAYVPLDAQHPDRRLIDQLHDTAATVIISDQAGHSRLAGEGRSLVGIAQADGFPNDRIEGHGQPDSLAYVIFTSGSTGRPKGVAVTHLNVVRLVDRMSEIYRFEPEDVWTCTHSYAFDWSVSETWAALLSGAASVIVDTATARAPEGLLATIQKHRVTRLSQTPSAFSLLTDAVAGGAGRNETSSLRTVIFGGEALNPTALAPWFERLGEACPQFVNMYGITETTVHVTHREILHGDTQALRSPIGSPLTDLDLRLFDLHGQPVPIGVPGEVFVGGLGVARGYIGRPALTAERFVPDPFSAEPGGRLYRSGDVAQRTATGDHEYLGRMDQQVKVRGYRIEVGEVEIALAAHPDVQAAAVNVHGSGVDTALHACVVAHGETPLDVADLRRHLSGHLPPYMLPEWWTQMSRLPLTSSGKVDRGALPGPDGARPRLSRAFIGPRDGMEQAVAETWAQTLGIDRVGVHDNFFALGGNSIKAVRLAGRLSSAGFAVSVADVFMHQTVAELAEVARSAAPSASFRPVGPFELITAEVRAVLPEGLDDAYPMSLVQAGMIYEMLTDSEVSRYHNVTSLKICDDTPFKASALSAALELLVRRHAALRTTFDLDSHPEPLQLVWSQATARISFHDLRAFSAGDQRAAVEEFIAQRRAEPLDITQAPLFRLEVHQTGATDFWLSITECHAILDGWSYHSLVGDLFAEYRSLAHGRDPVRPGGDMDMDTGYADFVALERSMAESAEQRDFWAGRLAGAEPLILPAHWGDRDSTSYHDVSVPFGDLLPALRALAENAGVPLKSVLLTAHLVALGEATGQRRFRSGLVCNGRLEVQGGDDVRGMFLNTVPFAVDLAAASWTDLVRAVFQEEVALLPFRRFPMPMMKRLWGDQNPLPDVIFNYLDFGEVDDSTLDRSQAIDVSPNEAALHVTTEPGSFLITAYAGQANKTRTKDLGDLHRAVLDAMADDPGQDSFMSFLPADHQRDLARWNATAAAPPAAGVCDRVAVAPPGATAVICGEDSLTYFELNDRADRLARRLRRLGARSDTLVAVMLPRSVNLVVALLGILKSGAAFVPLDAAHPRERLAHVLSDSGAALLLVEPALRDRLPATDAQTITMEEEDSNRSTDPSADRLGTADGECLAYVIYTSGSTGTPKGVAVTRDSFENLIHDMTSSPQVAVEDVFLSVTTVAFDISVLEVFGPLAAGATLVLADDREAADPSALSATMRRTGVSLMQATPVTWQALLDTGWLPDEDFTVLCGGEHLPTQLGAALISRGATVWDLYGPTETTVWSARRAIGQASGDWQPLANNALHLLDRDLRPVQDGALGEIYISGLGLARGYLNRPALTAERFLPDPFAATPGARMYRTGDSARREHLTLQIHGRLDHQVKVRGFRVELAEVEAVLADAPGVRTAVVGVHGEAADRGLVGYILPGPDGFPGPETIRAHVASRLPGYMVPTWWVELSDLPLTPNGKVDRAALPAPEAVRSSRDPFVAPRNAVEATIAATWADVLGIDRVGAHDDFFDLGGHSLLALRVIAVLRRDHHLDLTLRDLVLHRSVAAVAAQAKVDPVAVSRQRAAIWYRRTGDEPPLFCVHPGGGSGHWYEPLSQAVGDRQPIAAFEWPGLNGLHMPLDSMSDMVDLYLKEITNAFPNGPYRLLGWCGGSAVAWDLVKRLRASGEHVDFWLLDPVSDLWMAETFREELALFDRCEELFAAIAAEVPPNQAEAARDELARIMRTVVDDDRGVRIDAAAVDEGWRQRVAVWRDMALAQMSYRFEPLPGGVRLVVGDEVARERHEVIAGRRLSDYVDRWREIADGPFEVVRVPGDHFSVLQPPQVGELAEILGRR